MQRAADEELHREVVDALGVGAARRLPGLDPAMGDQVANEAGHRLEALAAGAVRGSTMCSQTR